MGMTYATVKESDLGPWDTAYLGMARYVARLSKDPKRQVGAVLIGDDKRKVAVGVNGLPPGMDDEKLMARPDKNRFIIHAERNALDNADFDTRGSTLYATRCLCVGCAMSALSRGVTRVVMPPAEADSKWYQDHSDAFDMLKDKVQLTIYMEGW